MVPVGYMAKRVLNRSDRFQAPHVVAVFSVSDCNCENFTDYIPYWKQNGYWLFDSPEVIRTVARENSILLQELRCVITKRTKKSLTVNAGLLGRRSHHSERTY
jgi:hypothetical protein